MATIDKERVLRRVRSMIGSPGECEVSDEWLEDILLDAVREFSRDNPICEVVAVAASADVANYPFPDGFFDVDHTVSIETNSLGRNYNLTGYEKPYSLGTYNSNGLYSDLRDYRRHVYGVKESEYLLPGYVFREKGGMLNIEPTPCQDETLYVPLLRLFDLSTFPCMHERSLMLLMASLASYERAALLGKISEFKTSSKTTVKFRDPKWLREEGARYRKEYRDRMGASGHTGARA